MFESLSGKINEFISLQIYEIFSNEESILTGMSKIQEKVLKYKCDLLNLFYSINLSTQKVSYDHFYNEVFSEEFDPKMQLAIWIRNKKNGNNERFCIIDYPWMLEVAYKAVILKEESKLDMHANRLQNIQGNSTDIFQMLMNPRSMLYFNLSVRRDHIMEDALNQLGISNQNMKMPLNVKFVGEQGIDEGGVRKEFFQLIFKQLFDPIYGMFVSKKVNFE